MKRHACWTSLDLLGFSVWFFVGAIRMLKHDGRIFMSVFLS